jgi:hypothetical protein
MKMAGLVHICTQGRCTSALGRGGQFVNISDGESIIARTLHVKFHSTMVDLHWCND